MRPVYGQVPDGPPEFEVKISGLIPGPASLGSPIPLAVVERVNDTYSADLLSAWHGWYQPVWELFPPTSWYSGIIPLVFGEGDDRRLEVAVNVCVDSTATKRYVWVIVFAQYVYADPTPGNPALHRRVFRHAWRREISFSKSVAELQNFVLEHREPQCASLYPGIDNDYIDWSQATCRISAILPAPSP
jgi:hypothetical protein